MEAFIVIPCLNEQDCLAATCASLGFGRSADSTGRLVLVDNGSIDGTLAVMSQIRDASPTGRVQVVQEPKRGYVAARRAGMAAVLERAQSDRLPIESTLVLQADADTIYLPGYVNAMLAACTGRRDQLLEGCAVTSREFNKQFPEFAQLCRDVDAEMERWFAPEDDQVVIDDKVCGFLLVDYCDWGEHQLDVDVHGRLVHAETTRLFMRAKSRGAARRQRVETAQALPSRRKLLTQAAGYFACSGFPRDREWSMAWARTEEARSFLTSPRTWPTLDRLVQSRQRHQLALFGLLPALFQEVPVVKSEIAALARSLRDASSGMSPGWILSQVLSLADEQHGALSTILGQSQPRQP